MNQKVCADLIKMETELSSLNCSFHIIKYILG